MVADGGVSRGMQEEAAEKIGAGLRRALAGWWTTQPKTMETLHRDAR
jgi:hypothetical protein